MEEREETLPVTTMTTTTTTTVPAADFYLSDECWDCIFKFLKDGDDHNNNNSLKSLSVVSKDFLSITNRLILSLTIKIPTRHRLSRLFQRFPNLTSLNLTRFNVCKKGFCSVSSLASSLVMDFVVRPQLKSLYLADHSCLREKSINNLASVFPNLQLLDLSYCRNISEDGICHVLRTCSEIRHLNLTRCSIVQLHEINIEVPKLEVLNLSQTKVDDETLHVISKSCRGLLQLLLECCSKVTEKGVKHVVENCIQLREINLKYCHMVNFNVLCSLILSRPSLRKLSTYYPYRVRNREILEQLARQGCIVSYKYTQDEES